MDLMTVSRIYHWGGTLLPIRLALLFAGVLALVVLGRFVRGRWRTLAGFARQGAAGLGLLASAGLVLVELVFFRGRCPLCLVASAGLLAAFLLLSLRRTAWTRTLTAMALMAAGLGYLLPFGTIPRMATVPGPPPGIDFNAALRAQGSGPVRVQVFEDFQCRACAQLDRALASFLDQNEEKFQRVDRHLPLTSIHPWAERAALVSECAARQGRFEEAKKYLFARQAELGTALDAPLAEAWNLPDPAAFRACVEERHAEAAVRNDVEEARRLGLRSTPSLLIGRTLVAGSVPRSRIGTVLEFAEQRGDGSGTAVLEAQASGCTNGLLDAAGCSER